MTAWRQSAASEILAQGEEATTVSEPVDAAIDDFSQAFALLRQEQDPDIILSAFRFAEKVAEVAERAWSEGQDIPFDRLSRIMHMIDQVTVQYERSQVLSAGPNRQLSKGVQIAVQREAELVTGKIRHVLTKRRTGGEMVEQLQLYVE